MAIQIEDLLLYMKGEVSPERDTEIRLIIKENPEYLDVIDGLDKLYQLYGDDIYSILIEYANKINIDIDSMEMGHHTSDDNYNNFIDSEAISNPKSNPSKEITLYKKNKNSALENISLYLDCYVDQSSKPSLGEMNFYYEIECERKFNRGRPETIINSHQKASMRFKYRFISSTMEDINACDRLYSYFHRYMLQSRCYNYHEILPSSTFFLLPTESKILSKVVPKCYLSILYLFIKHTKLLISQNILLNDGVYIISTKMPIYVESKNKYFHSEIGILIYNTSGMEQHNSDNICVHIRGEKDWSELHPPVNCKGQVLGASMNTNKLELLNKTFCKNVSRDFFSTHSDLNLKDDEIHILKYLSQGFSSLEVTNKLNMRVSQFAFYKKAIREKCNNKLGRYKRLSQWVNYLKNNFDINETL